MEEMLQKLCLFCDRYSTLYMKFYPCGKERRMTVISGKDIISQQIDKPISSNLKEIDDYMTATYGDKVAWYVYVLTDNNRKDIRLRLKNVA